MKYINDIYSAKAFHWLQFIQHNNLGFFSVKSLNKPPHEVEQDNSEQAFEAYHNINNQIIKEFGLNESFLELQKQKEAVAMLQLDFVISGNKMKRTEYRIKELEIQTPEQHNKDQNSLSKELSIVSNKLGIPPINIKDWTIHQYLLGKNS
jgi:hypothetical protein